MNPPTIGETQMFDLEAETLEKNDNGLVDIYHTRFSIPIPTTNQRVPFKVSCFLASPETPEYLLVSLLMKHGALYSSSHVAVLFLFPDRQETTALEVFSQ